MRARFARAVLCAFENWPCCLSSGLSFVYIPIYIGARSIVAQRIELLIL